MAEHACLVLYSSVVCYLLPHMCIKSRVLYRAAHKKNVPNKTHIVRCFGVWTEHSSSSSSMACNVRSAAYVLRRHHPPQKAVQICCFGERAVPAGTHAPISVSKIVATRLIVEPCPLAKLNDGLSRLHSADEDTVSYGYWSSMVHDTHIRAPVTGLFATLPVRHLDVSHPGA